MAISLTKKELVTIRMAIDSYTDSLNKYESDYLAKEASIIEIILDKIAIELAKLRVRNFDANQKRRGKNGRHQNLRSGNHDQTTQ